MTAVRTSGLQRAVGGGMVSWGAVADRTDGRGAYQDLRRRGLVWTAPT